MTIKEVGKMEKLIVEGGVPLDGEVEISGAKNAALPLITATLLCAGRYRLKNVPDLRDTRTMLRLMEHLGITCERDGKDLEIDTTNLNSAEAPYELVKTMRASVLVLGPLLARTGVARISLPGGCAIGARPINYHLSGFEQLGVKCSLENGYIEAKAENRLKGNVVYFDMPSVTATENLLMAATLARGTTIIKNAAKEPEIGNLIDMLTLMGADIEGKNTDLLTVHGRDNLTSCEVEIIPDRIEAGTYLIGIAATGGQGGVKNCIPEHLPSLIEKMRGAGILVEVQDRAIMVDARECCKKGFKEVDITTMPYPGYPTDLQAQFMALMTLANGVSVIHETIFENRFMHVAELQRMGASISIDGRRAMISGKGLKGLTGAPVMATDLRASSSLVIAGLAASGMTEIARIYHLERGYESMVEKLAGLGADIARVRPDSS